MTYELSDLMWAVVFSAIAVAGFALGNWAAWTAVCGFCVVLIAKVISVIVTRGAMRAASIGFLVPAILYLGITLLVSDYEYSFARGTLPSSQIMQKRVERDYAANGGNASMRGKDLTEELTKMALPRLAFIHLLIACVAGFAGSRYATIVHAQSDATT